MLYTLLILLHIISKYLSPSFQSNPLLVSVYEFHHFVRSLACPLNTFLHS